MGPAKGRWKKPHSVKHKEENFMKVERFLAILLVVGVILGTSSLGMTAEVSLKDYDAVVVQDLEVPSGSPAPESAGMQMAEKAVYQIKRYNQSNKLFEAVVKEGKGSKEAPSGKKVLVIKGEVKEWTPGTIGGRIGRSFIPGVGGHVGSSYFAAHYKFVDKESGKIIYETDLRTSSTGSNDTVEYAMDRNGEALAKIITKFKGK